MIIFICDRCKTEHRYSAPMSFESNYDEACLEDLGKAQARIDEMAGMLKTMLLRRWAQDMDIEAGVHELVASDAVPVPVEMDVEVVMTKPLEVAVGALQSP